MHPRPIADTLIPVFPKARVFINCRIVMPKTGVKRGPEGLHAVADSARKV